VLTPKNEDEGGLEKAGDTLLVGKSDGRLSAYGNIILPHVLMTIEWV
jgi:hypothetical protein